MTTEKYHQICAFLRGLIKGTPWEGSVYTVGGCCRDSSMGLPIKDIDLAVNKPDGGIGFAEWLHEKKLTIGAPVEFPKYGTARLRLKKFPDDELELVQTRSEKYTDRTTRDPSVVFGSVKEDCFRRDLTINSLYYDISNEKLLDLTGKGIADIEAHIIRTPADPDVTYDDDPVRILRTIRFSARYDWRIDPDTFAAMCRYSGRLSIITPERMESEFEKILTGPRPGYALSLLREVGAIPYILPAMTPLFEMKQSDYHFGTAWEHTLAVVDKVPEDAVLRYAALFHDIGKTVSRVENEDGAVHFPGHPRRGVSLIDKSLRALRCRTPFIDRIIFFCVHHEMAKKWGHHAEKMTDAALRRMQFICYSKERMDSLLTLIDADNRSYAPDHCMPEQVEAIRRRSRELTESGDDMFGYVMPLKPSKIRRILKVAPSDSDIIENVRGELLDAVYRNPHLTAAELAAMVEKIAGNIPEEQKAIERKSKKRRSRRRKKRKGPQK